MTGERRGFRSIRPRCRAICAAIALMVVAAAGHAQTSTIDSRRLERCTEVGNRISCRPTTIEAIDLQDPIVHIRTTVDIPEAVAGRQLPIAVTLVGAMSSEVHWNGVRIGSNGVVGADASTERPGSFRASIIVPRELVHVGENRVDVRMSSHHRWLPVEVPVQQIRVGLYEGRATGDLRTYWPALLTTGALILAALYFAVAAWVGRGRDRVDALVLTGVAVGTALQLLVETTRAFFDYPYPLHIARIAAIVVLAVVNSSLVTAYVARRFAPRSAMRICITVAAISMALAFTLPTFDIKAWGSLFWAGLVCLFCTMFARHRGDGRIGMVTSGLYLVMLLGGGSGALDRGYYLFMAVVLAGLVAEKVLELRRVHSGLATEKARNDALALRLESARASEKSFVAFKDGASVHRFAENDVVRIKAADDFCELTLTSRRPLLVGGSLKALAEVLPDRFVRVHKSHIVNLAHVVAMNPKPGGGHELLLSDQSSTPVGRTYRRNVMTRLQDTGEYKI